MVLRYEGRTPLPDSTIRDSLALDVAEFAKRHYRSDEPIADYTVVFSAVQRTGSMTLLVNQPYAFSASHVP